MTNTTRLNMLLWSPGITQADVVVNAALDMLDIFVAGGVKSRTTNAQPGSPAEGDAYIITGAATGAAWSTYNQYDIAVYRGGAWTAYPPMGRIATWVDDAAEMVVWDGSVYQQITGVFVLNKNDATIPPTITDDSTGGYSIGSRWTDVTGDKTYFCVDNSVGAAIWQSITAPLTTKGDLFGFNTAYARIPVGANKMVVTADSAQALGLKWAYPIESLIIAIGDETTAITTGTAKITFRMPYAFTVTAVRASLNVVSTSGLPTFDINETGISILGVKLTIDVNEKTSTTAAAAATITDAGLANDAEMTIDIDVAGTGAKGAKIYLIGRQT